MAFEIIDANGARYRYEEADYIWQYGHLEGAAPDKIDKDIVEVVSDEDEIVVTFFKPIAVGNVDWNTSLIMPREIRHTQCPRCGYIEEKI
jgi:hypothetical protein